MRCRIGSLALLGAQLCSQALAGSDRADGDWRQHCGSADHNNERAVKDVISCPEILWRHPDALATPAVFKGRVYVPGKKLWVLDLKTGKELFPPAGAGEGGESPRDEDGDFGTPVVLDDRVIALRASGAVRGFDLDLGKCLWSIDLSGLGKAWAYRSPAFADGMLVVAGGPVLGVDPAKGEIVWKADALEGAVEMSPALWQKKVFFGTREGRLYALDLATGKVLWKTEHGCHGRLTYRTSKIEDRRSNIRTRWALARLPALASRAHPESQSPPRAAGGQAWPDGSPPSQRFPRSSCRASSRRGRPPSAKDATRGTSARTTPCTTPGATSSGFPTSAGGSSCFSCSPRGEAAASPGRRPSEGSPKSSRTTRGSL
jgi:hypothetical protein